MTARDMMEVQETRVVTRKLEVRIPWLDSKAWLSQDRSVDRSDPPVALIRDVPAISSPRSGNGASNAVDLQRLLEELRSCILRRLSSAYRVGSHPPSEQRSGPEENNPSTLRRQRPVLNKCSPRKNIMRNEIFQKES